MIFAPRFQNWLCTWSSKGSCIFTTPLSQNVVCLSDRIVTSVFWLDLRGVDERVILSSAFYHGHSLCEPNERLRKWCEISALSVIIACPSSIETNWKLNPSPCVQAIRHTFCPFSKRSKSQKIKGFMFRCWFRPDRRAKTNAWPSTAINEAMSSQL